MSNAPTVVKVAGSEHAIRFTIPILERIEQATGMGLQDILESIVSMIPRVDEGQDEPTPEQLKEAAKHFRIGFAGRFVSGAIGVPLDTIPIRELQELFVKIAVALFAEFGDEGNEIPKEHGAQSGGSGHGLESTSGSNPTNSTGSSSPTSAPSSESLSNASGTSTSVSEFSHT